jgi:hypothetical protein
MSERASGSGARHGRANKSWAPRSLDDIPRTSAPSPGAVPSALVARLRSIRPSRRTVLRGLVIGAAAAALVPLDWYLDRRTAAALPASVNRAEHTSCAPSSYAEESNNWPLDGPAVCYGGWRRGSYPCTNGYHREGYYEIDGEEMESTRLSTECEGKNAWRWKGYRCSDAITDVVFAGGDTYTGITIGACPLPEGAGVPVLGG